MTSLAFLTMTPTRTAHYDNLGSALTLRVPSRLYQCQPHYFTQPTVTPRCPIDAAGPWSRGVPGLAQIAATLSAVWTPRQPLGLGGASLIRRSIRDDPPSILDPAWGCPSATCGDPSTERSAVDRTTQWRLCSATSSIPAILQRGPAHKFVHLLRRAPMLSEGSRNFRGFR